MKGMFRIGAWWAMFVLLALSLGQTARAEEEYLDPADAFVIGAAGYYKSKRYGGQPDTAAPFTQTATGFTYSQPVPAYGYGEANRTIPWPS